MILLSLSYCHAQALESQGLAYSPFTVPESEQITVAYILNPNLIWSGAVIR